MGIQNGFPKYLHYFLNDQGNVQHPNISKQNVFFLIVLLDQNIKNTLFVCRVEGFGEIEKHAIMFFLNNPCD